MILASTPGCAQVGVYGGVPDRCRRPAACAWCAVKSGAHHAVVRVPLAVRLRPARSALAAVLRPVVVLGLEGPAAGAGGAFRTPLLLARGPFGQAGVGRGAFACHLHLVGQLGRQLQADAVGVEEVDALEDVVVGHAQHFHAVGLQPGLGVFQLLHAVHAEGDVVDPQRGVGGWQGFFVVADVKEGDELEAFVVRAVKRTL